MRMKDHGRQKLTKIFTGSEGDGRRFRACLHVDEAGVSDALRCRLRLFINRELLPVLKVCRIGWRGDELADTIAQPFQVGSTAGLREQEPTGAQSAKNVCKQAVVVGN